MDIISENLIKTVITPRPLTTHKGNYGRILLIGGFDNYHGAIIMASKATVFSGAGLVTTLTDQANVSNLNIAIPEVMALGYTKTLALPSLIKNYDVILIGPGLGLSKIATNLLRTVLNSIQVNQTLIIDGSALTLMAQNCYSLPKTALTVLTPHTMEWQRISNILIKNQTVNENQRMVNILNAHVVLKKYHTEVYQPHGTPLRLNVGGPYQATGGMGDTLAGIIAGFLGQFPKNQQTVAAATFIHSKIADELAKTQYVVLPTQITAKLPEFMHYYSNF
ncbi:hydroxyethylthiazole kinase-like uncharacterized protein yjeF [Weissella beninensis]|uniref:ADP-dependent (S)-NAD(P)H-hydrate dehydratase n=1 Tax=Periweissella beninensis TaxID=504936 RepID=A0ABT0VFP6_9LACO|nr:NAD(P)H-hydrate dehydratase [Periweissella beninensis]MBM7543640.1 hydroxyethylthiazole kinase-like uncharacterized protein yjeF [Periweissella beninensis]MCM2436620.1 NAD(P)H-hydrate dehydratase [Periweissella beninensis]